MNVPALFDLLVKQTPVLIAQLATSGGVRAPLAHVASQVFLDLVAQLEEQGVSRKVGADMFGLALRTSQRKIQRLSESTTNRGHSLWEAVYGFLQERRSRSQPEVQRSQVFQRFRFDDDVLLRGVIRSCCGIDIPWRTKPRNS